MKEAQPIADAGSLSIEASQATRRSAADSGEGSRAAEQHAGNGTAPEATLAPEDADRFAMAFRPSWEPVAPPPAAAANGRYRSFASSFAPAAPPAVNDASGMLQDDLLHLRAARVRSRSLALAAVSILSFFALVYWGISSTTDGAERSATRALQPPPAEEQNVEEAAPPAPARVPEQPRLTARLADPNAPALPAEAEKTEAQAPAAEGSAEAQSANAAEPAQAAANENAAADPGKPAADAKSPATITDVKPATAADARPLTAAAEPPAAAEQKPASSQPATQPGTPAAAAKPATPASTAAVSAAAPAVAVKPSAAAGDARPAARNSEVAAAAPKSAGPAAMAKPAAPSNVAKPAAPSSEPTAAAPKAAPSSSSLAKAAAPSSELAAAPRVAAAPSDSASAAKAAPTAEAAASRSPLLVVRAVPDSAQLFLDGQRMANPFDTRLPLGSKHKIDARQDGYETSSQSIRLESDAKLTITLKRATPAPEPHLKVKPLPESPNGAGFVTSNPY